MTASSVTGVGQGAAERGLPPYRSLNQTLKLLASDGTTPLFALINGHYVTQSGGTSPSPTLSYYRLAFTNGSLTGNILSVTHNLGIMYVAGVTVYDNNNQKIIPNEIMPLTANTLSVDLTTFTPLTGTWNLIVIP